MSDISPELIRAALSYVPADLDHDTWRSVGMAINDALPDADGLDIFDSWSAGATEGYNRSMVRAKWRSFAPGRGIGVGTLFEIAKRYGFTPPKADQAPAAPTPAELAERQRQQAVRRQQEEADRRASHEGAAAEAQALWDGNCQDVTDPDQAPYLKRKGVKPYGVRFTSPGTLVVPLRDALGKLWNVQRIAASKPKNGAPEKWFIKSGRKSGLWHLLGGEQGDVGNTPAVLLIAEGYATAASLHEATGHPVAVAFDAGNLQHVARALRKAYPAALLVVCGDDDRDTEAQTGTNPGRQKATEAAKAVRGLAVFPDGLPDGGSDFNDMHQREGGAAGLDAVRGFVQAAIDAHAAQQQAAQDAKQARAKGTAGPAPAKGASGPPVAPPSAPPGAPASPPDKPAPERERFMVVDEGVFHRGVDKDGEPMKPEWVCSRLDVEALTRDQDGHGWGYLLIFADPLGRPKQWAMPARMLAGDGGEYRARLLDMGLRIATNPRARNLLTQYIQTRAPDEYATCTDRVGWHGRAFVLPHETIGDDAERIVFQSENAMENTFRVKGTAEQWRERVAALCAGNSRLVFAVACAFAGPLLRPGGVESGGFHFRGDSSSGKSTALKAAASVYGGASYLQTWKTTDNALEMVAAHHCDGLLLLDELAQVDPKVAGECAYMLANERNKRRATRNMAGRPQLTWRLLFLSSGEIGLIDHMAEGGKRPRAGQEVRMADIPVDAGAGLGAFENLHGLDGGAAFSRQVVGQAGAVYGAAGRAWHLWLTENADSLKGRIREVAERLAGQLVPEAASGQVERVGARFALVGAAGELATAAGLTGWAVGESERAARTCFNAWLAARGGIGNGEVTAMLKQARSFLELHGEGRFGYLHRSFDDRAPKTLMRAGWRRLLTPDGQPISKRLGTEEYTMAGRDEESTEYLVLPEVFKKEMASGYDPQTFAQVLADHGCLVKADKGPEGGRFTKVFRIPGMGSARCYQIAPRIFDLDM